MPGMFDLRSFGLRELDRAMQGLAHEVQTKVMRGSVRKSCNRLKNELLLNASGRIVDEDTGTMVDAFEAQKVGTRKERDGTVVAYIKLPPRAALKMPRYPKDTEYPPTIIEYGQPTQPPRPFMRKAVDDNYEDEIGRIGNDVGRGAARAWRRFNRRAA